MVSHKSKYLSKTLLIFVIFTFFVYSLLLCYFVRIKKLKLFGIILLSIRRVIEHCFKIEALSIVPHFFEQTKSMPFFSDKSRTTHNAFKI